MAVPRSRILDLMKVQCRIFHTTYNPNRLRLGNSVLRQRLKGPAVAAYYPRRPVSMKTLMDAYPELETWDDAEEDRLDSVTVMKSRGKGAPKKKKTKEESKKFGKKKPPKPARIPGAR